MQYVLVRSGVTYEWIHVTCDPPLRATTLRQAAAPSAVAGSARPLTKLRSTRKRGIFGTSFRCVTVRGCRDGGPPRIGGASPYSRGALPILGSGGAYGLRRLPPRDCSRPASPGRR